MLMMSSYPKDLPGGRAPGGKGLVLLQRHACNSHFCEISDFALVALHFLAKAVYDQV